MVRLKSILFNIYTINFIGFYEHFFKNKFTIYNNKQKGSDDTSSSKAMSNEPKTYAQFFKSETFGSSINFVSNSSANSGRTSNTANTLNSRSQSSRTGPIRGEYTLGLHAFFPFIHVFFCSHVSFHQYFRTKIKQCKPVQ